MKYVFHNGSTMEILETENETVRATPKEADLSDIEWFADMMGLKLFTYQKVLLWLSCRREIRRAREKFERLIDNVGT